MIYPDIFPIVANDPACTQLLGVNPTRLWPFGQAPQDETRPYATHQMVIGIPMNMVSCPPSMDEVTLQVDCFAKTATASRTLSRTIAAALTKHRVVVTSWDIDEIDQPTGLYRVAFSADFIMSRV